MDSNIRLDAEAVKVLAHPLRSRLLTDLRRNGPATATELAERLDTNTGATSYHLRKLESVGLVEDTGQGEGKRRLWQSASRSHSWMPSDFAGDEDAETSLGWLTRDYVRQASERMQQWLDAEHGWPREWRDAMGMSDELVLVDPAQAETLVEELLAVLARYRTAGADDPAARKVSVSFMLHPTDARHE
jgi:predicted ArsR family transcriptional regulator